MAGIAPKGMEPEANVVQDDEAQSNVSPEEQAAYDDLVTTAQEMLYSGGKAKPEILAMLDEDSSDLKESLGEAAAAWDEPSPDDPSKTLWQAEQRVIALAGASVVILLEAVQKTGMMEKAGEDAGSIILHAGQEILEDIAELAEKAGVYDYSEAEIGEAFRKGADLYREAASDAGLVDKQQAAGEFDEIVAADREGKTNDILPGLEQAAAKGGAQ